MRNGRILIVDDYEPLCRTWARGLTAIEFEVRVAYSLADGRKSVGREQFNAVLLDLDLGDGWGDELLDDIEAQRWPPKVAVVSAHLDADFAVKLLGRCVMGIPKPALADAVIASVERMTGVAFGRAWGLSQGELAVVQAGLLGMKSKDFARIQGLSPRSVDDTWRRVFAKTGCHDRNEVLGLALRCADGVKEFR